MKAYNEYNSKKFNAGNSTIILVLVVHHAENLDNFP